MPNVTPNALLAAATDPRTPTYAPAGALALTLVTLSPAEVSQDLTEATSAADGANSARTAAALMKCR